MFTGARQHAYAEGKYLYRMPATKKLRLGERIRQLREARGWSQGFLAKKIGVSRPTVSQWESGDTKNIKNNNTVALAQAFDVTIEELFTGTPRHQVNEPPARYGGAISEEERVLIEKYRKMKTADRRRLQAIAAALDAEKPDRDAK